MGKPYSLLSQDSSLWRACSVAVRQLVHSFAYCKLQRGTLIFVSAQLARGDGLLLTRHAIRKDSGELLAYMRPVSQPRKLRVARPGVLDRRNRFNSCCVCTPP